jgi:tripartite-type tricarboxylate transporter receptor subunit TctC
MNACVYSRGGVAARFAAAGLAFFGLTAGAFAAGYPERPIRLVIPFSAGGGSDTLARILAPRLTDELGQQLVVDNRPGAAGNIAAEIVADASPNGYTVLMGFNTVLTVNPTLYKLNYKVQKDFQPVTLVATAQYILAVNPSVPAHSVKELIALAKSKPGKLNYASAGVGSPLHLSAELFKKRAGINMVHIPYKGGSPAAAAVVAGEAQVIFGSVAATMRFVKSGRLRALATTGSKRSTVAPDLPTIAESGFPGFDVRSWYAFLVPAGTPMDVVRRLHDATVKALGLPEIKDAMAKQGLDPEPSTPQELADRIKQETAVWADVIKEAGIKVK